MSRRAPSICAEHGCPDHAVYRGRCTAHRLTKLHGRDGSGAGWRKLREQTIARDHGRCVDCASTEQLEAHHVLALEHGGRDELENLQTLCHDCHIARHAADGEARDLLEGLGESTAGGAARGARMPERSVSWGVHE